MMTTLLPYLLKVVVLQTVAYGVYRYLLEDTPGVQKFNRWYLLTAPLLALAVPLLTVRYRVLPAVASAAEWTLEPADSDLLEVATVGTFMYITTLPLSRPARPAGASVPKTTANGVRWLPTPT